MNVHWDAKAWVDYLDWQVSDTKISTKINELIQDIRRNPFPGLGKPEPLKGQLSGWWSRRITDEHRLVYRVQGKEAERVVQIAQCRFHYKNR